MAARSTTAGEALIGRPDGMEAPAELWVHQDYAKIVDIGMARAAHDQPSRSLEERRRIVVVERLLGVGMACPGDCPRIDDDACGVAHAALAAVDAVGIRGQSGDAGKAVEGNGQRQRVLL